jgi:predicted DsbA family dithiol-disulfide isomerase
VLTQIRLRPPSIGPAARSLSGGNSAAPAGVRKSMRVDIWSDVVCPWCYVGKRRFEAALAGFPHRADVEVVWHSFELDPRAPRLRDGDRLEHLAAKYGVSRDQAAAMDRRIAEAAREIGLEVHLDRSRSGNTFDAHRLLHLAAEHGLAGAVKERFLRGYFTEGEPIGDHAALARLAVEAGLPAADVDAVLTGDRYADAVRADEATARAYGATAVPFFVIDETYGIAGAQPPEVFTNVLERAWAETHGDGKAVVSSSGVSASGPGDACTDGACSV